MDDDSPLFGLSIRQKPMNLQAEQALLGAILANNKAFEKVADFLLPDHFCDPVHGRIYQAIASRCSIGVSADPITLRAEFLNTGILEDIGGVEYLATLLSAMVGISNVGDYGRNIYDCWLRRQLIDVAEQLANRAFGTDAFLNAPDVALQAISEIETAMLAPGSANEVSLGAGVASVVEEMFRAREPGGRPSILSTGIPELDEIIAGGLRPGQLTILGGRPGHGKSALALQIALFVAEVLGLPVFMISLEMTNTDQSSRALAAITGVASDRIETGRVSPSEAEKIVAAQRRLSNIPLYFDDRPRLTMSAIRVAVRRFKRKHGAVGLVIADHLHIVAPDNSTLKSAGLVYAIGEIANQMKELAKNEVVPVLALAQLNRGKEAADDKVPTLADLKSSGDIEAAADKVLFTHRPELHLHKAKPTRKPNESDSEYQNREMQYAQAVQEAAGKAILVSAKVRGGRTGSVELLFDGETTTFKAAA